jgi:hypothetical protein
MITEISMKYTYMINSSENVYTTILVGKNASLFLVLMISNVIHWKMGLADISSLLIKYWDQ